MTASHERGFLFFFILVVILLKYTTFDDMFCCCCNFLFGYINSPSGVDAILTVYGFTYIYKASLRDNKSHNKWCCH